MSFSYDCANCKVCHEIELPNREAEKPIVLVMCSCNLITALDYGGVRKTAFSLDPPEFKIGWKPLVFGLLGGGVISVLFYWFTS